MPHAMLTNESVGKDWKTASHEERLTYVETCCCRCVELGLKPISASLVEEGISEYYRFHEKFHHELGDAFGVISSAVLEFGNYRRLTDKWT
jgi:hypothetical protein